MKLCKRVLISFGLLLLTQFAVLAQGTMKGTIVDAKTKEPRPFVNVMSTQDGKQVRGGVTDFDGIFTIKPLAVGKYDIEVSFVGYTKYVRTGINVAANGFTVVDVELTPTATNLEEVVIVEQKVPVIEIGQPESGARITSDDIARMPGTSVESIVAAVGGVGYSDGGTSTARGESNMVTMQGGVRKRTGVSVPKDAIAEIQVILGGTPASIGEAIGGTQIITLKPPTPQFKGMVRWETYLDYRLYNQFLVYLTGPVYKKNFTNDDGSSIERTLVGFRLTGQATYEKSPFYRVRSRRYLIVNDDLVRQLEQSPLAYDPIEHTINYAAELELDRSDFVEFTRLRKKNFGGDASRVPDLQYYSIATEGALDFRFSDYATLTVTGEFSASHNPSASLAPLNMTLSGAQVTETKNMALTIDFTQRFRDAEAANEDEAKSSSSIKNVMYNISGMVNRYTQKVYNENFGSSLDDVFKYGHIGTFIREKTPSYERRQVVYDGIQQWAMVQNDFAESVQYIGGDENNSVLANYNNQLFYDSTFVDVWPELTTIDFVRKYKGLFNGDSPSSVYSLINNVGYQSTSYVLRQYDYLYLQAKASADIFGHEIEVGFQYDQMWQSSYSLAAGGLWTLMRNNANRQISGMDVDNPIYTRYGSQLFVNYNRKLEEGQQTAFDAAFRSYLIQNGFTQTDGRLIDNLTWIDIDRYSPEEYVKAGGLSMFSAEEMFNSGNSYVSYRGYDHTGKKYNARNWNLEDFFNPTGNTNYRYLPSFSPIYMAGYIQDKFYFQDLIFNVGVRVDYYNGNQWVLKDPYLLYHTYTAAEIYDKAKQGTLLYRDGGQYLQQAAEKGWIPYVTHVPNPDDESAQLPTIVGYRDGTNWYNADGVQVASPNAVVGTSGKPTPYRTPDGQRTLAANTVSTEGVFEAYTPQIVAMPRIAFSFPVGDAAQFKASYDIIARRPSTGWEANYLGYLYMLQVNTINNPNLKPERITNYELGFQRALDANSTSAISASAYYKETRDLIQLVQYNGADPNNNYYSYDNNDFRTIKGVTLAYDLRKSKNIRVNANYTLQYAEGTGLSTTTMTELIKEGYTTLKMLNPISDDRRHEFKANVDFRYGTGSKYNGPTITRVVTDKETGEKRKKEVKLLENFGVNFMAVAQSGRPYTKAFSNSQSTIVGSYYGARLPWGFYFNIVADKVWPLKVGKRETFLTAAITVNNLFDIRNIVGVFAVTGNPDDNGYLTDAETQHTINSQLNPQSYRDLYAINLRNNYWNYSSPRTIKLSLSYNF